MRSRRNNSRSRAWGVWYSHVPMTRLPGSRLAFALALTIAGSAEAVVSSWHENPHSRVRLITPYAVAAREGPFRLGVEFRLVPGWHAYWRNSGDAGFPPSFDLRQTPQLESPTIHWPAPQRYALPGDLIAFGYADQVIYALTAQLRGEADVLPIAIAVDYLVCAAECVPYRYDLELDQPLGPAAISDLDSAANLDAWSARTPKPGRADLLSAKIERTGEEYELIVRYRDPAAKAAVDFFPDSHDLFELGAAKTATEKDGIAVTIPLTRRSKTAALPNTATFSWVLTGLEDGSAVEFNATPDLPKSRLRRLGTPAAAGLVAAIAILAARRRRARARQRLQP